MFKMIAARGTLFFGLLFASVFGILVGTATTADAAMIYAHARTYPLKLTLDSHGTAKWHIGGTLYWNESHYANSNDWWAHPENAYVIVDSPGNLEACGILDGYNGTDITFDFSNYHGAYVHQGKAHRSPCVHDTRVGIWIDLSPVHRMHYHGSVSPTFSMHAHVHLDIYNDPTGRQIGGLHRLYSK